MAYLGAVGVSSRAKLMRLVFTTRPIAVDLVPEFAGILGVAGGYIYVT